MNELSKLTLLDETEVYLRDDAALHEVSKEIEGNPIAFSDGTDTPLVNCRVSVSSRQDLHGYDKPWVGGAGKNKISLSDVASTTQNGITYKCESGFITVTGTTNADISIVIPLTQTVDLSPSTNKIAFNNTISDGAIEFSFYRSNTRVHYWALYPQNRVANDWTDTGNETVDNISLYIPNGKATNFTVGVVLMDKNNSDTSFSPYSNICPISGYDEVEISVAEDDQSTPTTYTISLGSTRYGGELDVSRGVLRVTHGFEVYDGSVDENWSKRTTGSAGAYAVQIPISDIKKSDITSTDRFLFSSYLETVDTAATWGNYDAFISLLNQNKQWNIVCGIKSITTLEDWKTYLSNNELTVVYELATPLTISLTPTQVRSLLGSNYMSCNSGDLSVEYITEDYQPLLETTKKQIYEELPFTIKNGKLHVIYNK